MFTVEQKSWQLHENGVTYGELAQICQYEQWDEIYNPDGPLTFSMNDAIEKKWAQLFGKVA